MDEKLMQEAETFALALQDEMRSEGVWLADLEFVRRVHDGSAPRWAIANYATQFFVAIERLHKLAHARPSLATIGLDDPEFKRFFWENRVEEQYGAISNTAGHLELLIQLGEALGVKRIDMVSTKPNALTRRLLDWSKAHVSNPDEYLITQVAIGMLESMNPDASLAMAEGGLKHYGLNDRDVRFWTVHITADAEHGEVGVKMLTLVPKDKWPYVRQIVLEQAHLVADMWNNALVGEKAAA